MYFELSQKQVTELKIIGQTILFWVAIGLVGLAKFHIIKPIIL